MSLVYAKKSDEIECARLVFIHGNCITACEPKCVVPSYLMYLASRFVWLRSYESLLTYVAHMDLVGDPLQGTCFARASGILITKIHKIFYLGIRRIFM